MTEHRHDRGYVHAPPQPDDPEPSTLHHFLGLALIELMIEKGHIGAAEMTRMMERIEARTPAIGARIVARAWTDAAYKARLLADGAEAMREMGVQPAYAQIVVLENTPKLHNVVVCTLCSCYPRAVLGMPPGWYKSKPYRARAVREPRAVLAEFGTAIPDDVEVRVHDSTAEMRYLVLPMRPQGTGGWSAERLAGLVTRDSMIGVGLPDTPL